MTKQLNHSLNKFHLRIVSVQNCCVLEGNELSIRLYLYFFFQIHSKETIGRFPLLN
ncbi:helix-turn-helix domain-containing protein [Enterococcus lactis]|nr:helix-turn-helix domain-containing protein [Enterococcus lactis]